jgi:hypothetical protein
MNNLPDHVKSLIYEYDNTYRDIFDNVLLDINKHRQEEIIIVLQIPELQRIIPLKVFTTDTIYSIKHYAKQIYGLYYDEYPCIECKNIKIDFKNRQLDDKKNLNEYNIIEGNGLMVYFIHTNPRRHKNR